MLVFPSGAYLGPCAGALLQGLGDSFVLSLGLINSNSSSFNFFEETPAVLVSPIVSVELYNSAGNDISELAAPLLLTFPRPELQGRFRAQCVFWDEGLQAWSTNGVSLVSETTDQVTCAAEHLSLLALLFFPFACSNAAAIFSQQGLSSPDAFGAELGSNIRLGSGPTFDGPDRGDRQTERADRSKFGIRY
eukprot:Skav224107  [mRNA]  locus=scaffold2427:7106:9707:+ [translate_table: standard]